LKIETLLAVRNALLNNGVPYIAGLQILVNICLRRIINIKWTEKITNEKLCRITHQKSKENQKKRRKCNWISTHYIKKQEQ